MSRESIFIALLALTAAIIVIAIAQIIERATDPEGSRLRRRISQNPAIPAGDHQRLSLMKLAKEGGFFNSALGSKLQRNLLCTFPNSDPLRVLLTFAIVAFVAAAAAMALMHSIAAGVIAAIALIVIFSMYTIAGYTRRQRQIDDQLPDALDFLSRVLRAGHSLVTGLLMATDDLAEPLSSEFRRCYDRHSVGLSIEEALREMAIRLGSPEFTFMVMAVAIQRQSGGDLAEILDNISRVIRARIRLRQHVHAITAEGRLVGNVLLVLPVIFFFISYALNPAYTGVLLTTTTGRMLIYIAITMQVCGWLSIRKIVAVKM